MHIKNLISFILLISISAAAYPQQSQKKKDAKDTAVLDIGSQIWIISNLNVDHFANGERIPEAKTKAEWERAFDNKTAAWCYYNNDPTNKRYGKLYNWFAVADKRGLAPKGWHVPTDYEWDILIGKLVGKSTEVNKRVTIANYVSFVTEGVGHHLKSSSGWHHARDSNAKEIDGNGDNSSGFTGLPAGFRNPNGTFSNVNYYGIWWCSGEATSEKAWSRGVSYGYSNLDRFGNNKGSGFSVRCIRNLKK